MARIKCGKCKGTHESVAAVKACYQVDPAARWDAAYASVGPRTEPIKSDAQWKAEFAAQEREQEAAAHLAGMAAEVQAIGFGQPQVKDGFYTVKLENGEHRTIRLRTQPADARFAPGEMIASFLSGPSNESDYTGFAFVKPDRGTFNLWKRFQHSGTVPTSTALQVILNDPAAPAQLYAQESGNCYRCNRLLTVPESIAAGIGPTCAEQYGAA